MREHAAHVGHTRDIPLSNRPMWAVGAIAFRGQFETRVNRAAELRFGLRPERCRGSGRERCRGGRAVGPSCKVGRVERKDGNVGVNIYSILSRVMMPKLGEYICARTIARIRQHANKEH